MLAFFAPVCECPPDGGMGDGGLPDLSIPADGGEDGGLTDAAPPEDGGAPEDGAAPDSSVSDMAMALDAGCDCMPSSECVTAGCVDGSCVEEPVADGLVCGEMGARICVGGACVMRGCGDGFREPGPDPREGCDDGNMAGADSCSEACVPLVVDLYEVPDTGRSISVRNQLPQLAVSEGGSALAVWIEEDAVPSRILARRLFASGAPNGDPFEVHTEGQPLGATVVGLDSDRFVVVWRDTFPAKLHYRIIPATGPVGPARAVAADAAGEEGWVTGTRITGGFVLVWEDLRNRPGIEPEGGIYARRFDLFGNPLDTEDLTVASDTTGREREPRVASSGSSWAVVFSDTFMGSATEIVLRRFDAASPLDAADVILTAPGASVREPNVASLDPVGGVSTGAFVATWTEVTADAATTGSYARRVDLGTDPAAVTFLTTGTAGVPIAMPPESAEPQFLFLYREAGIRGADVVSTRSALPMEIEILRQGLDDAEGSIGLVAGDGSIWAHWVSSPAGPVFGTYRTLWIPNEE